jgi:hypothetical protein
MYVPSFTYASIIGSLTFRIPYPLVLQGVPFTVTLSMVATSFLCDKDFVLRDMIKGTIYITDYLTLGLLICADDKRCKIH